MRRRLSFVPSSSEYRIISARARSYVLKTCPFCAICFSSSFVAITKITVHVVYVKLYNDIVKNHNEFGIIFKEQIQLYLKEHTQLKHVSQNEDYDKYCLHVKQLDNMKHFTIFLSKTLKYNFPV